MVQQQKGGDPVSKFTGLAMALGILAITAGSAFAECGSHATQSVSLETQTASTGSTDGQAPMTPKPESSD
jgi:hypothetical protein